MVVLKVDAADLLRRICSGGRRLSMAVLTTHTARRIQEKGDYYRDL